MIKGKAALRQSDGGLVSALRTYLESPQISNEFSEVIWVGAADFKEKHWLTLEQRDAVSHHYKVEPVFIEQKVYDRYYNGFCNATLWPLFHYFPSFVEYDQQTFEAFEEVNGIFLAKVVSVIGGNDTIWIHDYQLMMLPSSLRKMLPRLSIGFFLHIPFPSYEVFRLLHREWKEKIIDGLLGADLIGFHTHEYVQHFLKSVQMIKGLDHQFRTIQLDERIAKADMFPLGIDFQKFNTAGESATVIEKEAEARAGFQGKKIIFSVDRLDYTKGINHRLNGYERFLEKHPEWKEKIVFVLVIVPSRVYVSKYSERKKMIEQEIGRINGKHASLAWQPIIYRYNHLSFEELTALYRAADIGLITPLRDGMNLVAKEYVASKSGSGVLILSELAGAANELSEAILVNPLDRDEVCQAISLALKMPEEIQRNKIESMQKRLREYTVNDWIGDFLRQLDEVKLQQASQGVKRLSVAVTEDIVQSYKRASRKAFLLDYDGTLVPYAKYPQLALPNNDVQVLLAELAKDVSTDVTVISGRDSAFLQNIFSQLEVNLISEHGGGFRRKTGEWRYFIDNDQNWKPIIRGMMEVFTHRTPGSFIEEKSHTLAWHYRNVGVDLGFTRSRELLDNLHHMTRNANLNIVDGNKVIEVRVAGVDKGTVARRLVDENNYDFIVAIGDDKTDEDMFRALSGNAYTIKVGSGPTIAQYYVTNYNDVLSLLSLFSGLAN
jgi:trehalose 6-phosphate synthase/phosphatase